MRVLVAAPGAVRGAVLFVGVGGTLGVQRITDAGDESADCQLMNTFAHNLVNVEQRGGDYAGYIKLLNDLLDARYKVCHA